MKWEEIKKAPGTLGNIKVEMTFPDLIKLVNTEIIEKLIEDIPGVIFDSQGGAETVELKQQLRDKWL